MDQILSEGWISSIEWLSEIDSTNAYLKRRILGEQLEKLPQLVVSDQQTAGRGRGQNAWWSPEGCLMFSIAWQPDQPSQHVDHCIRGKLSQLPLVIGVSIAKALNRFLSDKKPVKVKWPNDVYVNGKKLGGILIESIFSGSRQFWVIGAGVNLLVKLDSASEPIRSNATSLDLECRSHEREFLNLETILVAIVHEIQKTLEYWQLQEGYLDTVWPEYCILTDRWIEIQQDQRRIEGKCVGIDDRGALLIQEPSGNCQSVLSGVVLAWS